MVATRATNADAHPGRILQEGQRKKRSRKQIDEDAARAKAVAAAARKEAKAKRRADIATIAAIEDSMKQNEGDFQAHSARPDLRHATQSSGSSAFSLEIPSSSSKDKSSDRPMGPESEDDSGGAVDLVDSDIATELAPSPKASMFFASSISGSDVDELQNEFEGESEESEDVAPRGYAARMKAEKAKRESLRSKINEARAIPHTAPSSQKRKEPVKNPRGLKRCDAFIMGGFSTDWKAKVKHTHTSTGGGPSRANTEKGNNGSVSVTCYDDEPSGYEALERAKASKSTTWRGSQQVASGGGSGLSAQAAAETAIKLIKLKRASAMIAGRSTPLPEGERKRQRKQRHTVADLPFPGGSRDVHTWRKAFLPLLHGWAGTQEDPFGSNCQMEGEVVKIWKRVFPSVALDQHNLEIVLNVCDNALNNWRSGIGKAGYLAVSVLWKQKSTAEDIKKYVSDAVVGLNFVYKFPHGIDGRGPFCSDLISKVYAAHLRKILPDGGKYGPQIGGLALATVAVERGLTLFKTGSDILKTDDNDGRGATRVRSYGFTEKLWGNRARALVLSTGRLKDSNWAEIYDHASIYLQGTDYDEENGEDSGDAEAGAISLHAQIEID